MKALQIKQLLGIPRSQRLTSKIISKSAAIVKSRIIAARRNNNDVLAADLSQLQQIIKKKRRPVCIDCGVVLSNGSRCERHSKARRYYSNTLA